VLQGDIGGAVAALRVARDAPGRAGPTGITRRLATAQSGTSSATYVMSGTPPGSLRHSSPYCRPPSVFGITRTAGLALPLSIALRQIGTTFITFTQADGRPGEPCSSSMAGNR
jgi:hypothetical protein